MGSLCSLEVISSIRSNCVFLCFAGEPANLPVHASSWWSSQPSKAMNTKTLSPLRDRVVTFVWTMTLSGAVTAPPMLLRVVAR